MAEVIQTSLYRQDGFVTVLVATMAGTNTLQFQPGEQQFLVIENSTGSAINPLIKGLSAPDDYNVQGLGEIDLSGGYAVGSIAAGVSVALPLHNIHRWLKGSIELTGVTGAKAYIVNTTSAQVLDPVWIQGGRLIASGRLTVNSRLWG